MPSYLIRFRDGTTREFKEQEWDGKVTHAKYDNATVSIIDPFGKKTTIPLDLISEVEERRGQ